MWQKWPKHRLLPTFFCLIVHVRKSLCAFCEPREPEVKMNNCPIKLWLGGNCASQHPAPLLHSLVLGFISFSHSRTHTQALKHKWTRCAAPKSQKATNPEIIAEMILSRGVNEEMVKLSGCEGIKEADAYTQSHTLPAAACMTRVQLLFPGVTRGGHTYLYFLK